jgi:hypothetical protein
MKYEVLRGINYKEKRFEPGEVITTKDLPKNVIKSLLMKKALVLLEEEEDGKARSEGEGLPR